MTTAAKPGSLDFSGPLMGLSPPAPWSGTGRPGQSSAVLERNLQALAALSPDVARQVRGSGARDDVRFVVTEDGVLSATIGDGTGARALASKRRPLEEAKRLADTVTLQEAGVVVVLGFGAGHHAAAMTERMRRTGLVIVFEPDLELLRAVLERIDHSAWIGRGNVFFLSDAEDGGAISAALRGAEGIAALGVKFLEHPATRGRIGVLADRFSEQFTGVMKAVRTSVVTTLVQVEVTLRNCLMNLDHFVTGAGVADLAGSCAGKAAVVVSAGPSLQRNIELLARPGVRDRVVIIAAQTVLKVLLKHGIKPHFVTALDYHEISRRFYEGLTPADVEGVTLIAEPKANPAILEAFPGTIRCPGHQFLNELLGPELVPNAGELPSGATVAHLAYYFARHLGCDPVLLVGQDLGFTDGQYYSAGAAIHDVWACELNGFNTLEMMEWQRIVRMRSLLRKGTDVLGRGIYTDEQMSSYLVQFERDFLADTGRGLTVIDATEGGVAKRHTVAMPLAEALERYAPERGKETQGVARASGFGLARGSGTPDSNAQPTGKPPQRKCLPVPPGVVARVRKVRQDVWKVAELSRKTHAVLSKMIEVQQDQARVNRLIDQVNAHRDEVMALNPAFELVQHLNQTGLLNRVRSDRAIELEPSLTPAEKQRRQIERDMKNVAWLADAADQLGTMLDDAVKCLGGAPKQTRDPRPAEAVDSAAEPGSRTKAAKKMRRIWAIIPVDPKMSGLGTPRDLAEPFLLGDNPLRLTLRRLARCTRLSGVVLLAEDPDAVKALAGPPISGLRVEFVRTDGPTLAGRAAGVRGARLWSEGCWRGGLGTFTCYDEVFDPGPMAKAMEALEIDAGVLVGADWALVDPQLTDAAIERYLESPEGNRLTFTQAPPGLAGCVIDRTIVSDLAERGGQAGVFGSIGGMLGYIPIAPQMDPIGRPMCVAVPAAVRNLLRRCIPDSGPLRAELARALTPLGESVMSAAAVTIAGVLAEGRTAGALPQHLAMELCTGRRTSGLRARWELGAAGVEAVERTVMVPGLADKILRELGEGREDAAVTFAGAGDPLLHPEWRRFVAIARRAGIAGIHLRTDLLCEPDDIDALLESGVDVISVNVMAGTPETYRQIMGVDRFAQVHANLERLLEGRAKRNQDAGSVLPTPWIVPRITRCDAAYEEIEQVYDRWLMVAGACVIDSLPGGKDIEQGAAVDRIRPLPPPGWAVRAAALKELTVLSDGTAPLAWHERSAGDLKVDRLEDVWRKVSRWRAGEGRGSR
jgi:hypothetical protein